MSKRILGFSTRASRTLVVLVVALVAFVTVQPRGSIAHAANIEQTALSQATLADLQAQMAVLNARWQKLQEQQRGPIQDATSNTQVMSHTMPMADTMVMSSTMPQGAVDQDEMRQLMQMMTQMNQMMSQMQTMVASDTGGMSVMPMSDTTMSQMPQTQNMMCGGTGGTATGGMGSMCGGGGGMMGGMGGMMGGMGAMTGSDGMTTGGMDMMGPMMDMMSQMMGTMGDMMGGMGSMSGGMQSNSMGGSMSSNTLGSASSSDLAAPVTTNILTQTAIIGTVIVAVKPVNLTSAPVDTVDFVVTLEGDAEALVVDLTQVAKLQIEDREVSATAWEPTSSGEQLVSGILRFPATGAGGNSVLSGATKVGLVFRNLTGENQQTFTWNLTRQQ